VSAPDTSAEAVERVAQLLDEVAEPLRWNCATRNEAAALLRALVAERDHWKATFHARYVEDVRDTKDAYARGWREGAGAMREACAREAAEHGGYASNDMDADHLIDRMQARGRMDMADEIRAAIRALPLPEPQA